MKNVLYTILLVTFGMLTHSPAQNVVTLQVNECQQYMTRSVFPQTVNGKKAWFPFKKRLEDKHRTECLADPTTVKEVEVTHNLRTSLGSDWMHQQLFATTAAGAQANYLAVTTTVITPAAGNTTLTGELTGNGMARKQATVSHTAGTNTTLLSASWTYDGGAGTITINGVAVFTAASAGTMTHIAAVTSAPTATNNGDVLTMNYQMNYN